MAEVRTGFAAADRESIARLLWDAFSGKLGRLLGDRESAVAVLGPGLRPEAVLTAGDETGPVGVLLLKDGAGLVPIGARFRDYAAAYGPVSGWRRLLAFGLVDGRAPSGVLVVDALAVAAPARGRGVGTALLDEAERVAAARGHRELMLEVLVENDGARRLYERVGYRVVRTQRAGPLTRRLLGITAFHEMRKPVPMGADE